MNRALEHRLLLCFTNSVHGVPSYSLLLLSDSEDWWEKGSWTHVLFVLILTHLMVWESYRDSMVSLHAWKKPSLLCLSPSRTHKHGGASWEGQQARLGRTARNTCNRLVLLMLGNKSSHPSLVSLSSPWSMHLIGRATPSHFKTTTVNIQKVQLLYVASSILSFSSRLSFSAT